jgi:rRNA-processing protein CGR1
MSHPPVPLALSANGRASGKPWKSYRSANHHHYHLISHSINSPSHRPVSAKWHRRIDQTKKFNAVKKLEQELKDEKKAELQR